ncbi:Alkaline phosphatase synthesis sensor protein PhoR [Rosistilla carotiformis]|uniref:histidine kinase n=1 Tax=Rosistilla carotiformis TaxID=2528017 RepID=A0A518JX74_9BACT|nr:HAMP domain-containing sensor histidine kinase [Rosistilla carotiformis]QDV70139.1 Alkaline phosphatase synthesis sensor protein PhoR [Rosistilla carotiformis]
MFERRSIKWPVILGVVMILLVVTLTVGWVVLTVIGGLKDPERAPIYWASLSIGAVLLICMLAGVIVYLTVTVKAIKLNQRQSNFIDSVTHELKSPIASLKLYLQTLSRRQVTEQQRQDFHRFMMEDVERLDNLINHLLDAARLDREAEPNPVEDCRIDRILNECAQAVCLRYRQPMETVTVYAEPAMITAPPVDLGILFRNLIDNAVKYSGSPPEVIVRLRPMSGGKLCIRITDNGPGIPKELRRKIFGRFIRVGNELERAKPGTGLGLYLVRTLVKSLRGTIRVEDRRGTEGTEFEVLLPGVRIDPSETDATGEQSHVAPTGLL